MADLTREAAVLTASFSPTPATPAPAPTAPAAPTAPPPPLTPGPPQGEITAAEAAQLVREIREDVAKGKITSEEGTRRFDSLNTPMEARAPDTRSDEQKMNDAHFPAAKPHEFFIRYHEPWETPPPMTKELAQFDTTARSWLSDTGFTQTLGNSLVTTIERTVQLTKHMDENQLDQYGVDEFAKLEKCYGSALGAKLQQAAAMIHDLELKKPGLKNLLRSKGVGDNALVVAQIIGQSERWHARRKER